jgi:phage N-6-adenine-methyltransferase
MPRLGRPRIHPDARTRWRLAQRRRHAAQTSLKVYHRSKTVEWGTPQALFDTLNTEFAFATDVAAQAANAKCVRYFTPSQDGLAQPWEGVCWCNPPYGRTLGLWVAKAYTSALQGATVVCLVPVRTDTKWWQRYVTPAVEVRFLAGRLTFVGAAYHPPCLGSRRGRSRAASAVPHGPPDSRSYRDAGG